MWYEDLRRAGWARNELRAKLQAQQRNAMRVVSEYPAKRPPLHKKLQVCREQ